MLKIRLARGGKHKSPFYRVVLTEHTKPTQSGYTQVLGWFDPLHHKVEMDIETIKEWIGKGAQPSNRVAKLAFSLSKDAFFEKYIEKTDRKRKKKNAPDEPEEAPAPKAEEPKTQEAPKVEEVKVEEVKVEEVSTEAAETPEAAAE